MAEKQIEIELKLRIDPKHVARLKSAPVLREAWKGLKETVNTAADELTFAQLLEASGRDKEMYYI